MESLKPLESPCHSSAPWRRHWDGWLRHPWRHADSPAYPCRVRLPFAVRTTLSVVVVVAVVGAHVASCFSSAANARFAERVQQIDDIYSVAVAEVELRYYEAARTIQGLRDQLIKVGEGFRPLNAVSYRAEFRKKHRTCTQMDEAVGEWTAAGEEVEAETKSAKQCWFEYDDVLWPALAAVYWAADFVWALEGYSRAKPAELEAALAYSHNLRLSAYIEAEIEAAREARVVALHELAVIRANAVAAADRLREEEIAEARRQAGMALAAFAQGYTQASQSGQVYPAPGGTVAGTPAITRGEGLAANECSSDFGCGAGRRCLKDNFRSSGYCVDAVNEAGVRVYGLPDMGSVFVKVPTSLDCHVNTDCPVGFRCQASSGACVR